MLIFLLFSEIIHIKEKPFYEVLFPPKDKCLPKIIQLIKNAKRKIYLQCYSFTSKPIAKALIDAHNRGVKILVISDKSQKRSKGSVVIWLSKKGIPIYIDDKVAIAHNKIMIIDEKILMGSYNWTNSAENRNAENLLIIYNEKNLLKKYKNNFYDRLNQSKQIF